MILNFRCLLLYFRIIFGLNINMNKSEMVKLGDRGDGDRLAV